MAIFTNQATLTYRGNVTNSNVVTGEIVETLSAAKTALVETYAADDTLTYIISLVNAGATALTGITVTDDLGAYEFGTGQVVPLTYVEGSLRYYSNGTLQAPPAVTDQSPLTVTGVTVPAGGNALLIYQARVNQFAPLGEGATIVNTATVSGGGLTPVEVTETVTATEGSLLTISKSLTPTRLADNEELTYTFVIQNFGNTPVVATDDASVSDLFDPRLSNLTVTFNGETWTEGTEYNYDEATGNFVTVPTQITVPAATFAQDPETGEWNVTPGVSVLTVRGTV